MATVILLRHGRTSANASGTLAGRTPGVHLDDLGRRPRPSGPAERLAVVPLAELVTSPLERCRETARAVAVRQAAQAAGAHRQGADRVRLRRVAGPASCASWPGWRCGRRCRPTRRRRRSRAGSRCRRCRRARSTPYAVGTPPVTAAHGADAVWLAVSHGDVIKSVLADALGMHLDLFQRIQVDPASISVIRYTEARPYVLASNTHEGDLSWLAPKPGPRKGSRQQADRGAAVGGGAGAGTRA